VKLLRIKAKTTANNTQPSITRIEGRGAKFGRISRAKAYGGCAGVGVFGTGFEEAHDASVDIKATARCFWELKNRNILYGSIGNSPHPTQDKHQAPLIQITNKIEYAGFWLRLGAAIIDLIIANIIGAIIVLPFAGSSDDPKALEAMGRGIGMLCGWLYYAIMESSASQATVGKQMLGIIVTDENGNRIGFGKATGRFFGKFLSLLIVYIGFLMIGFTKKKQGLHDQIAGTLVIKK
jgi:uncharacterized RDD family membrane protein YckC